MSETGGAQIAYGDSLDAFPSFTALDEVSGWEIRRGRQDEFTKTSTGTATIFVNDDTGALGFDSEFPTHAQITLRGSPMFRGHVESVDVEVEHATGPSGLVSRVAIQCVDAFDFLSNVYCTPEWGHPATKPDGKEAYAFYEDGQVDDRMILALEDAGWPAELRSIFSGNVNVFESVYYNASVMEIIQDAADAEFPTIANLFVSNQGVVSFRGRHDRLNPSSYPRGEWVAGTEGNVTSGVAQIRRISFSSGTKQIINAALNYPEGMAEDEIPDMIVTDDTSIAKWGVRSGPPGIDLLTKRHNSNGNTGADEALLFSNYQVSNYSEPVPRVTNVQFRSLLDRDPRAAATWALMQGVEIGDLITLNTDWVTGDHFVESINATARELNGEVPYVEMNLGLSPRSYWNSDPF